MRAAVPLKPGAETPVAPRSVQASASVASAAASGDEGKGEWSEVQRAGGADDDLDAASACNGVGAGAKHVRCSRSTASDAGLMRPGVRRKQGRQGA